MSPRTSARRSVILLEVFMDLRALVRGLIDRDADLAAGAGHRLGLEAGLFALDVEVADLAEIEQPLVELGPFLQAAAVHVVREMIDVAQAGPRGAGRRAAPERLEPRQRLEIHVVDSVAVIVLRVAVDEVDERVADALDRRDAQLARPGAALHAPGAALEEPVVGRRGVLHAEGDGAHARAVAAGEVLRERARLGVDDEIGVALLVEQHVLVAVPGDRLEAHALEELAERPGIARRVLDELEAVGLDRVVARLGHDRILDLKNGVCPRENFLVFVSFAHATRPSGGIRARPEPEARRAVGHAAQPVPRAGQPAQAGCRLGRVFARAALRSAHAARAARADDPARRAAHALALRMGAAPADGPQGGRARGADRRAHPVALVKGVR